MDEEASIARPQTGIYIDGQSQGRIVKMDSNQTPFGGGDKNMYLTEITQVVIVIGSDMYFLCTRVKQKDGPKIVAACGDSVRTIIKAQKKLIYFEHVALWEIITPSPRGL